MSDAEKAILATMEKHGLTIKSEFVPLSKSRNANTKDERGNPVSSLNWKVTLQRNGRDVLTTDYGAGIGHCPSHNTKPPSHWSRPVRYWTSAICDWECENGFVAHLASWGHAADFRAKRFPIGGDKFERRAIEPKAADVMASLILDSDVLNAGGFEDWAANYGYDTDSRAAEKVYQACLEIALKVRAGIGETAMSELAVACEDY